MQNERHSFLPLLVTNFFGVLNDNFLKTLGSFVVIGWIASPTLQSAAMGLTAAALVLPYVLLSPLADRLTVLFPKCRVVRLAKWAELPIMAVAIAGFFLEQPVVVVLAILLMGLQSALYSPAKYALVRDIGGVERVSVGMGFMEGIAFLAVLAGTVVASWAADHWSRMAYCAALAAFAAFGLVFSYTIRAAEERNRAVHSINPIRYCARTYRMAKRYVGLNAIILTLSVFWWAAAMLQMGLLVYGRQVLNLSSTQTGMILALAAVGIVAGQIIAGYVDRVCFLLGANLLTGVIAGVILLVLFFVTLSPIPFAVLVGVLAFDMGFFKLPLDAEIQRLVKGPRLNAMLAYFNQVSFLFMMFASLVYIVVSWLCGPRAFLLVLGVVMLVTPVFFAFSNRRVLACLGHWILSRRYRVTKIGFDVFDDPKVTYLVLPNHVALVDPMLIFAETRDVNLSPLCDELYFSNFVAGAFLRTYQAVKVPDLRRHRSVAGVAAVRQLPEIVLGALASGKGILFYPSGHICTEPREVIGTRQLAHVVCGSLPPNVRVIGVRTSGLWGSIWSRKGRKASPDFAATLLKSIALWCVCLVTRRRRAVTMRFVDITESACAWAQLPRAEFNARLEEWYNAFEEPL